MSAVLRLARALRFRLWAAGVRLRLRRLGGDLVLDARAVPRLRGLPHVDIDGRPGVLTLTIGHDVKIGRDLVIDLADGTDAEIRLGDRVTLMDSVLLQPWGGAIRLGDRVQVRGHCELKSSGVLELGEQGMLGRLATIHCRERVQIGPRAAIAEGTMIVDSEHSFDGSATFVMEQPVTSAPITIGENVFIGTNAMVLRGTTIGDRAVVMPGAMLNGRDYPAAHVIGGSPARTLRPLG